MKIDETRDGDARNNQKDTKNEEKRSREKKCSTAEEEGTTQNFRVF